MVAGLLGRGDAGWSSPVARQAHNLKGVGSNPAPATTYKASFVPSLFLLQQGCQVSYDLEFHLVCRGCDPDFAHQAAHHGNSLKSRSIPRARASWIWAHFPLVARG